MSKRDRQRYLACDQASVSNPQRLATHWRLDAVLLGITGGLSSQHVQQEALYHWDLVRVVSPYRASAVLPFCADIMSAQCHRRCCSTTLDAHHCTMHVQIC